MQTPTGYAVNADGQFVAADWLKAIFNPSISLPSRAYGAGGLSHTALVVGAVGAFTCCAIAIRQVRG